MEYTTLEEKLILPEYGRNIQRMVKYCMTIPDREERTRCAKTIINIMGNLFPYFRDMNDFKHKLWDHLAVMSDFQLDIDYPYEVLKKENLYTRPEPVKVNKKHIKYMFYGRFLQEMIEKVVDIEDEREKRQLILLLANYMKKSYLTWNKEAVDNEKIFADMKELSGGKIDIDSESFQLLDSKYIMHINKNRTIKKHAK